MNKFVRLFLTSTLVMSAAAHAHTHLEKSIPADKAVLDKSPTEVMLHFSEPTKVTAISWQRKGESEQHKLGNLPKDPSAHITVALETLLPGEYTLEWRALGDDNHVMKGTLHFTVSAPKH